MSLSDCPECWETPCCCGYGYQHYSQEKFAEFIADILSRRPKEEAINILTTAERKVNTRKERKPKVKESTKVEYELSSMNEFIKHPTVEEFKNAVKSSYYKRKRTEEGKSK